MTSSSPRTDVAHATFVRWTVLVTAAAWMVAIGAFLAVTTPLWHEGPRTGLTIFVGVGGGVVMALVQAVVTGLWLFRVEQSPRHGRHEAPPVLRREGGPAGRRDAAGRW